MGIFLLIIAGLIAWVVFAGMAKGKARMAYADRRDAEREMAEADFEPHLVPSWSLDNAKLREFVVPVMGLAERRGVPMVYVQDLLSDGGSHQLMHLIALLERRGTSLTDQKIAAVDYIFDKWVVVPPAEQGEFLTADLKRQLGS